MKQLIRLNYSGIRRLHNIITQLKLSGRASVCPNFYFYSIPYRTSNKNIIADYNELQLNMQTECNYCKALFPRTIFNHLCPCDIYRTSYLIKRLKEIIKFNEEENEKINKF